jgi:hypothetical protein
VGRACKQLDSLLERMERNTGLKPICPWRHPWGWATEHGWLIADRGGAFLKAFDFLKPSIHIYKDNH